MSLKICGKPLSASSAIVRSLKRPDSQLPLAKNAPVGSRLVQKDHANIVLRSISRSRNSSSKGEPSWGLPGNCISAIEGCASSFALPVSPNGANPHAPGAPLIRIDPICKHGGNRDATLPANYGMSCKNEVFPEAG